MTDPGQHNEPTQPTSGATHDTTEADFQAPGMRPLHAAYASNDEQVASLAEYLQAKWPHEIAIGARPTIETPVETAVRLLEGLRSTQDPYRGKSDATCVNQYCNKPRGHADEHGWISFEPVTSHNR